jgi:hypothetical protein
MPCKDLRHCLQGFDCQPFEAAGVALLQRKPIPMDGVAPFGCGIIRKSYALLSFDTKKFS